MNHSVHPAALILSAAVLLALVSGQSFAEAEISDAHVEGSTATKQQFGAHLGSFIPRTDLQPGILVGLDFDRAIGPEGLRVKAGLDWVMLSNQDSAIVGPPAFPRARLDLIQESHVVSSYVGASYDFAVLGPADFYVGAIAGMSTSRSTFDAFGISVPENDVAALGGLILGARGLGGPVAWRFELGWREARHDLGDAGEFGEDALSGLSISAGIGIRR